MVEAVKHEVEVRRIYRRGFEEDSFLVDETLGRVGEIDEEDFIGNAEAPRRAFRPSGNLRDEFLARVVPVEAYRLASERGMDLGYVADDFRTSDEAVNTKKVGLRFYFIPRA